MTNCEDKPCCVHGTEPCEPQWYDMPGAFDISIPGNEHALCEHEYGICDVYEDEDEECDDTPYMTEDYDYHVEEDAAMEFGLWGSEC